jgi:hypothetical protein
MDERILVRGELSGWVHFGRVVAALVAIAGLGLAIEVAPWGWIVTAASAAIWIIFESAAWQARRTQTWLTLHPDGMEVEDRRGRRAIHDSQVTAVALETKRNLVNGEFSSTTRRFRLWTEDRPEPILMENKIKAARADPLAGLIERLLERLRKRMEDDLARGGTASGDGWHLSRTALTLGRPPNDQQLPLSEITAAETFDGRLCIWRRSSDVAVAKLPLSGRNVHLLPALIRPFLTQASDAQTASSTAGLGRVLFERRAHRSTVLAAGIAGVAMAAIGAAMVGTFVMQQRGDEGVFVGGLVLLTLGPVLAAVSLWLACASFRCHERGVWKATLLGRKTLRYDDIGSFQFSSVRHYHKGAYTGTQLTMRFRPLTADRGPPLRYSTRIKGEDEDLDRLRDHISRIIAARMFGELHAGRTVIWTGNLEFTPEGIRYRPSGFLSRKDPQLLRYSDYGGYDMKQGVFHLRAGGSVKPVMTEQSAAENFYPGFFLLLMLLHQPVAEQAAGEEK